MKLSALIVGACIAASPVAAGAALAQSGAAVTEVTIHGDVVRYEPGRTIVIRGADRKEVVYTLAPDIEMPAELKVGGHVTLYTEPVPNSSNQVVTRVVTTETTPGGTVQRTTEETRTSPSGVTTKTTTTEITGKVDAFQPGRSLTILRSDGSRVTYTVTASSKLPPDLVVGKTISVVPVVSTDPNTRVVQTVTYVTTPPPGQN
jgi:hypothetical protein